MRYAVAEIVLRARSNPSVARQLATVGMSVDATDTSRPSRLSKLPYL